MLNNSPYLLKPASDHELAIMLFRDRRHHLIRPLAQGHVETAIRTQPGETGC